MAYVVTSPHPITVPGGRMVAPGEEVILRVGAAQGLIDEGYAEPIPDGAPIPRRRRAPDRRN